ncbi:hypothetical protein GCM10027073_68600 [Streptomyces chlorus]
MRAKGFECAVTRAEDATPAYRRLRFTDGGMLAATGVHPTIRVRLWSAGADKPHQRAYTLVDPGRRPTPSAWSSPCTRGAPATGRGRRSPGTPARSC